MAKYPSWERNSVSEESSGDWSIETSLEDIREPGRSEYASDVGMEWQRLGGV